MKRKMIAFLLVFASLSLSVDFCFSQGQDTLILADYNSACVITDRYGRKIQDVDVRFIHPYFGDMIPRAAKGGVYLQNDTLRLLTVEHLFESGMIGLYFVIIKDDTFYAEKVVERYGDFMIMNLLKDQKYCNIYQYVSKANIREDSANMHLFKSSKLIFSICGDTFNSPGVIKLDRLGWDGIAIDRESFHGESGTIFYDQVGNLYVLSRTTVLQFSDYKRIYSILQPIGIIRIIDKDNIMILPWRDE